MLWLTFVLLNHIQKKDDEIAPDHDMKKNRPFLPLLLNLSRNSSRRQNRTVPLLSTKKIPLYVLKRSNPKLRKNIQPRTRLLPKLPKNAVFFTPLLPHPRSPFPKVKKTQKTQKNKNWQTLKRLKRLKTKTLQNMMTKANRENRRRR